MGATGQRSTGSGHGPAFPAGLTLRHVLDDIDAFVAEAVGWNQEYLKVGRDRFHGDLRAGHTASAQLARFAWSTDMVVRGCIPAGCITFAVPERLDGPGRLAATELGLDRVGVIRSGQDFVFRTVGQCHAFVLSVETDRFDTACAIWLGEDFRALGTPAVPLAVRDMAPVRHRFGQVLGDLQADPARLGHPGLQRVLEEDLLAAVLSAVADRRPQPASAGHRRLALRADDYLRANRNRPVTIAELCAAAGAPERSLHMAFRELFGEPPARYLRLMRLAGARRTLQRGTARSVTEAATDWGFYSLGEFAVAYRRHFGESPSRTLRRGPG